jgi:hypothetical protein
MWIFNRLRGDKKASPPPPPKKVSFSDRKEFSDGQSNLLFGRCLHKLMDEKLISDSIYNRRMIREFTTGPVMKSKVCDLTIKEVIGILNQVSITKKIKEYAEHSLKYKMKAPEYLIDFYVEISKYEVPIDSQGL